MLHLRSSVAYPLTVIDVASPLHSIFSCPNTGSCLLPHSEVGSSFMLRGHVPTATLKLRVGDCPWSWPRGCHKAPPPCVGSTIPSVTAQPLFSSWVRAISNTCCKYWCTLATFQKHCDHLPPSIFLLLPQLEDTYSTSWPQPS